MEEYDVNETEQPLCPHCIEPIGPFDHFCPACGRPITGHASTDPLGQVFAAGEAYRSAIDRAPRRPIVLVGMWLIFAPSIVVIAMGPVAIVRALKVTSDPDYGYATVLILILLTVGLCSTVYGAILWRATRSYFERKRLVFPECPSCRYDLRGTIQKEFGSCPECGEAVPSEWGISDVEMDT